MEYFMPCHGVKKHDWKPFIVTGLFPGALGLILAVLGLGDYSSHVPFGRPAGVINKNGVCYLATTIQMFDAVRFSLGQRFEAIFRPQGPLLEAYKDIHTSGEDCYGVPSCINPDILIKQWINFDKAFYHAPYIIKETWQHDGSVIEEELFPEKVGNGSSGHVMEVFEEIMKEIDSNCRDEGIVNPFEIALQTLRRGVSGDSLHKLTYVSFCPTCKADDSLSVLDRDRIITKKSVVKVPRLLTIGPEGHYAHHLPLKLYFEDMHGIVGCYRLLASAYYLPVIRQGEGFVGNHVIAIVRYGERWYECDNHTVTPFANENALAQWIDNAARITYRGRGMGENSLTANAPMISVYELI